MVTFILEAGIGRNIFQLDFERFGPLLTRDWIKSVWQYVHKKFIQINNRSSNFPKYSKK